MSANVEPVRDTATQRQIAWRRSKVAELDAQGYTQLAISDIMKVAPSTISDDIQWLRRKAAEGIKTYTQERLPHLFNKSMIGLTQVLNEAWKTSTSTKYERNRILALSLVKDTITARLDLASNADIIDKTALFVTRKRKMLEQLESDEEEYDKEELPTPDESQRPEMIGDEEREIMPSQQQEPTT